MDSHYMVRTNASCDTQKIQFMNGQHKDYKNTPILPSTKEKLIQTLSPLNIVVDNSTTHHVNGRPLNDENIKKLKNHRKLRSNKL